MLKQYHVNLYYLTASTKLTDDPALCVPEPLPTTEPPHNIHALVTSHLHDPSLCVPAPLSTTDQPHNIHALESTPQQKPSPQLQEEKGLEVGPTWWTTAAGREVARGWSNLVGWVSCVCIDIRQQEVCLFSHQTVVRRPNLWL